MTSGSRLAAVINSRGDRGGAPFCRGSLRRGIGSSSSTERGRLVDGDPGSTLRYEMEVMVKCLVISSLKLWIEASG